MFGCVADGIREDFMRVLVRTPRIIVSGSQKHVLVFLFILLAMPQFVRGQQTIVANSRSVDWRQAGLPGDTPPARSTLCAPLNPGATAAQINSAIAACPNGQTVKRSEEHTSELQSRFGIS